MSADSRCRAATRSSSSDRKAATGSMCARWLHKLVRSPTRSCAALAVGSNGSTTRASRPGRPGGPGGAGISHQPYPPCPPYPDSMKGPKTVFVCQECGSQSPKWLGRCGDCDAWNSIVEERPLEAADGAAGAAHRYASAGPAGAARLYADIELAQHPRLTTGIDEFDRVLGGGVVPGSLVLLGGEPGIGKSTLLLQAAANMARTRPALVIVDSVQTIFSLKFQSAPGSIGQVREAATQLLFTAKGQNIPTFLVGHVTKDGTLAGPKALEHVVDTVLYF